MWTIFCHVMSTKITTKNEKLFFFVCSSESIRGDCKTVMYNRVFGYLFMYNLYLNR